MLRRCATLLLLIAVLVSVAPAAPTSHAQTGDRYFPETGFTVPARFMDYWNARGGLPIFGYPTTAAQQEGGYLVQYFERNRFEYHPENAGSPYEILLGVLGRQLYTHQYPER